MKQELGALQRLLEAKERRMAELQSGSGDVPALKQHYDRVLQSLQSERDNLLAEKVSIMQVSAGEGNGEGWFCLFLCLFFHALRYVASARSRRQRLRDVSIWCAVHLWLLDSRSFHAAGHTGEQAVSVHSAARVCEATA
jgi:hypothetical protein